MSLTQASRASSSHRTSLDTNLAADILRKRKASAISSPSHASTSSSSVPSTSPAERYDWLFQLSPHLFPSTTILAAGSRPFEWLNTVDSTSPLTYLHSSHHIVHPSARSEDPKWDNTEDCCDCAEATQCIDGKCNCARHTPAMHTRDGLQQRTLEGFTLPPPYNAHITECNDNCKCSKWRRKPCLNRVVQIAPVNPAHRLLVFHTGSRGWGALTLQAIPERQYVCEYIGELISDALAESRSDKFLFTPDARLITNNEWTLGANLEPPTIDATQVGHIARFINHSCAPNCSVYQVLLDGRDPLKPHFAFFSREHIAAGDELTINYAYSEADMQRLFGGPCRCEHCVSGKQNEAESAVIRAGSVGGRGRSRKSSGGSKRRAPG